MIDDIYKIRAVLSGWIADAGIDAVLVTGGTGFPGGFDPRPCARC